jgi:hypothetical protein
MDKTSLDLNKTNLDTVKSTAALATESERRGLVPGVVNLSLDVVETVVSNAIAVVDDVRAESHKIVDASIDFGENLAKSVASVSRRVADRIDGGAAGVLVGVKRVVLSAIGSARETSRSATNLASTATAAVVGSRDGIASA